MCIEKCNMKKGSVTVIASQDCLERLQLSITCCDLATDVCCICGLATHAIMGNAQLSCVVTWTASIGF